jgi:imidazolonepropionase-like amidohydrolase
MSPREILNALTSDAAALMRLEKDRGTLAPGMRADVIAVAGNPLEDVKALRDVRFVMKSGRIYRPAGTFSEIVSQSR